MDLWSNPDCNVNINVVVNTDSKVDLNSTDFNTRMVLNGNVNVDVAFNTDTKEGLDYTDFNVEMRSRLNDVNLARCSRSI